MCMSDDKLTLINAIIQDDDLFIEITEYLTELSTQETTEETSVDQEEEESEENPFKATASKTVCAWE